MANTRKKMNSRKQRQGGKGYLTDVQYFTNQLPPAESLLSSSHSSAPTATNIRPTLLSTYENPLSGGKKTRKHRKASRKNSKSSRKHRKASRKSSRK